MNASTDPIQPLVQHAACAANDAIPGPVVEKTADLLLDTLGCILAGSGKAGVSEVREVLSYWGGRPMATVLAFEDRTSAPWAALLNSAMGHACDFDDTHDPALNHGCVTLAPAVLAAAEASCLEAGQQDTLCPFECPVSGAEVLAALAVGLDVSNRLGLAFIPYLHTGWLPTTLWGPIACAAAVGRLLHLDEEAMGNAFGLAYSQIHGNREALVEGALAKRLQPAFSAVAGIQAAFWAQQGIDAAQNILGGPFGIPALYTAGKMDPAPLTDALGEHYETSNVSIKPYPSCRCTHPVIDAALALRSQHDLDFREIESGTIRVPPNSMGQIGRPFAIRGNPTVDAQFSAPYTAALTVVKGCPRLDDFVAENVRSSQEVRALAEKLVVEEFAKDRSGVIPVEMSVILRSSQTFTTRVETVKGSPDNPLSESELLAKFDDCVEHGIRPYSKFARARIVESVRSLQQAADVRELFDALGA